MPVRHRAAPSLEALLDPAAPRGRDRIQVHRNRGHRHPDRRARRRHAAARSRPARRDDRAHHAHARIHGNASQSLHSIVDLSRCFNDISERFAEQGPSSKSRPSPSGAARRSDASRRPGRSTPSSASGTTSRRVSRCGRPMPPRRWRFWNRKPGRARSSWLPGTVASETAAWRRSHPPRRLDGEVLRGERGAARRAPAAPGVEPFSGAPPHGGRRDEPSRPDPRQRTGRGGPARRRTRHRRVRPGRPRAGSGRCLAPVAARSAGSAPADAGPRREQSHDEQNATPDARPHPDVDGVRRTDHRRSTRQARRGA